MKPIVSLATTISGALITGLLITQNNPNLVFGTITMVATIVAGIITIQEIHNL